MNDIRTTIDLLEAKEKGNLEQIKLPYARTALSPVMSSALIDLHYGKLYKGYVDRFNKHEGDRNFNEAGAYLHSIFFSQFKHPGVSKPHGQILDIINRHHTNFIDFKKNFKEEAMKIQGSGWCYLSKSGQIKTIHNHAKRTDIALLVDMWEHSYQLVYGSKKDQYIDSIWRIIDWDAINRRL
jgi:Fe-Mn family superoxide dismutase